MVEPEHPSGMDEGLAADHFAGRLAIRLEAFIRHHTKNRHALVSAITTLPGHAGVSFGFIHEPAGERLVIRLAPAGAPAAGPNDVVRQARIMDALGAAGIRVPKVRWYDSDPAWFGRPFFITEFVAGDKPALGDHPFEAREMAHCARDAVSELAALHRLDWRREVPVFGDSIGLADELGRLDRLLNRPTIDAELVTRAPALAARLLATIPPQPRQGCVHGDFNWSNCLFDNGRLTAIIDWELAQAGAVLIDLGWLCLFSDRASWVSHELVPACAPSPDELIGIYGEAAGEPIQDETVRWFRAFAAYRFGVITAFNLMLHRRGKRIDPMWETIARSAPRLFERGFELLGQ